MRGENRGFAPGPTKRLCLLDLRQGAWPLGTIGFGQGV